eukprot:m.203740 g.203740  ORF g.203740 m.203740 type:complete len:179 (+) comp14995_c0_seq2:42-578(+)
MSISSRERELECARQIPSDNIPLANTRINSVAAVSLLTSRMSVRFTRRTRQKYGLVAYAVIIVASFWYREHIQEAADTMRAGNVRAREVGFETAAQLGTCEHKLATLLEELSTLKERRKDLVLTKNGRLLCKRTKARCDVRFVLCQSVRESFLYWLSLYLRVCAPHICMCRCLNDCPR